MIAGDSEPNVESGGEILPAPLNMEVEMKEAREYFPDPNRCTQCGAAKIVVKYHYCNKCYSSPFNDSLEQINKLVEALETIQKEIDCVDGERMNTEWRMMTIAAKALTAHKETIKR